MTKATETTYDSFQNAFEYFNQFMFNNELPDILVTLNRKRGSYGYFHASNFGNRKEHGKIDEIAMNPDTFDRSDKDILATFVHELVHHWQEHFGQHIPKSAYHNKEWVAKMKAIGLQPISETTGEIGTGTRVHHSIITFGMFDNLCDAFLATSLFDLGWQSKRQTSVKKERQKYSFRFECPTCGQVAKGAKTLKITCTECVNEMECVDDE